MNRHRTIFEDIYNRISDDLRLKYTLSFSPARDRGFWDGFLREGRNREIGREVISRGERALKADYPRILISDYREFSQNGNRVHFETKYFERRRMLCDLIFAECVEYSGRFMDKLLDGLYLILEETSWCLPAHNSYIRDTKQLPLPSDDKPVIDLFSAESAALVALAGLLLRDELSGISPFINEYIEHELRRRIFTPYLCEHFWWMGNGREPMCNWTPWITQNVLIAFFAGRENNTDRELLKLAVKQAAYSLDRFLDDYGEDGCCNEGAQYYSHAGLCLFGCVDILDRVTGDGFRDAFEAPLIKNIASYIIRMYVGNGYYINYADCSPFPGKRGVRDFLFALATQNPEYAAFSAADYRTLPLREKVLSDEWNPYYRLLSLAHHDEICAYQGVEGLKGDPRVRNLSADSFRPVEEGDCVDIKPGDFFFESVGLMVARGKHLTLAAKAGDNADSHNHNDVGSVTLYKDNRPLLIDLGVETYTAKTFSPQRYEIWTMQSGYHNTVNFYGEGGLIMQKDGKQYAAREVKTVLSEGRASLSMELSGAFGDSRIRSVLRTVTLYKNDPEAEEVVIEDAVDSELSGVLTFMTCEKPETVRDADEGSVLIRIGSLGEIEARGIRSVAFETCPITDERLGKAWKDDCYRILLVQEKGRSEVYIK